MFWEIDLCLSLLGHHSFQWKPFIMCAIVSVSQLKLSFSNTCQMTVKLLVLHLFSVPQTGSRNNENQIFDG